MAAAPHHLPSQMKTPSCPSHTRPCPSRFRTISSRTCPIVRLQALVQTLLLPGRAAASCRASSPSLPPMDFRSNYKISGTAGFIICGNFSRVGLQFPDELLKHSIRVVGLLRTELKSLGREDVALFVMADTTYGSCCVDEVGASHVDADCVVHYGHTCLSPTSTLPAFFVFGKAAINVDACVESLSDCLSATSKPALILFGLEYAHAMHDIKVAMSHRAASFCKFNSELQYAEVICPIIKPSYDCKKQDGKACCSNKFAADGDLFQNTSNDIVGIEEKELKAGSSKSYSLGGLTWKLPEGHKMEEYLLFWIGFDNSAFAILELTFSDCEIVRYDPGENCLENDFFHHKRILKRRYYLVEKAKDANIVGILVGTLGIAGYLHMIHQIKDLIVEAGKKAYLFVMGRPNPAKLANFPEFLAPVITPFEVMLAFRRGSQWTGTCVLKFRDLMASSSLRIAGEETRFSFFEGGYVEDIELKDTEEEQKERWLVLAEATKEALTLVDKNSSSVVTKGKPKSVTEFFASRSYHGLEVASEQAQIQSMVGREEGQVMTMRPVKTENT